VDNDEHAPGGRAGARAGDRDREAVVKVLREAYVAGCLDIGELRGRAGAAYLARTRSELRVLTADLPPGRPFPARAGAAVPRSCR
jgi:hypothetical protein